MNERSKRQKEAERMVKSLESGLLKEKPKKVSDVEIVNPKELED